jgi:hypothetical protein
MSESKIAPFGWMAAGGLIFQLRFLFYSRNLYFMPQDIVYRIAMDAMQKVRSFLVSDPEGSASVHS